VEELKDSNTLICLSNAVSFAMQIRSDNLIRKLIRYISRIAFFVRFFFKERVHFDHPTFA
jgi:hypothetical protein